MRVSFNLTLPGHKELHENCKSWRDLYASSDHKSSELMGYAVILGLMLMWGTLLSMAGMGGFEKGNYPGALWFMFMGAGLLFAAFYCGFGAWWGYWRVKSL